MTDLTLTPDQELSILQMVERSHREEIKHHRELQFRAFSWSNGLFLAAFAALIAAKNAELQIGLIGSALLTAIIASIAVTTLVLIGRSERALEANAAVVVTADRRMGLFTPGRFGASESIYPEKWLAWGAGRRASIETWFYVANTATLALAVIAGTWSLP